jgi:hypothetical protein
MHRDFQRVSSWYRPSEFVRHVLDKADEKIVEKLGKEMDEIIACPSLFVMDEKTMDVCRRWDAFCHEFFHAYQDQALKEVEEG